MAWRARGWSDVPGLVQGFGARGELPPAPVTTLRQVHGTDVVGVPATARLPETGDGLWTAAPGHLVAVQTADCVPVHLLDRGAGLAAAVHAGWRGAAAGILDRAFAVLAGVCARAATIRAARVEVALGPAICGSCYEVGEEVRGAFRDRHGEAGDVGFERRAGRLHLDLRRFLAARARELGAAEVEIVGPCTSCRPEHLASYRRDGGDGRQLSWIGWSGDVGGAP